MSQKIKFDDLQALLDDIDVDMHAAHLHGMCVGLAAGCDGLSGAAVGKALALASQDSRLDDCAEGLYAMAAQQMQDLGAELEPILPGDDASLEQRGDALIAWVQGFISGFGLSGAKLEQLGSDGREALHDLNDIAATVVDVQQDSEQDMENEAHAHAELVEFIRVVAMMLHAEVRQGALAHPSRVSH